MFDGSVAERQGTRLLTGSRGAGPAEVRTLALPRPDRRPLGTSALGAEIGLLAQGVCRGFAGVAKWQSGRPKPGVRWGFESLHPHAVLAQQAEARDLGSRQSGFDSLGRHRGQVPEWTNGPACRAGVEAAMVRIHPCPLGGLAESGKAAVSKTVVRARVLRGFESFALRCTRMHHYVKDER